MRIVAYTDGSCLGNPGPGGYGVLMIAYDDLGSTIKEKELCGSSDSTTNNQMEMTAAIVALETLTSPTEIEIITDSKYVIDGITKWIINWKKNNWRNGQRKPVKNETLWRRLDTLNQQHKVTWSWVKGHSGHPENERVDALAKSSY